ncbi:8-amino-7-oxononanoate synthase [Pseudobythopirellula maris]|uniref:8-amino-7-ketopelargonate synthase n=1 Tax=Pseudobythopirellula maris TaxID=2527991 RepID=A0A5C5ZLZ4_9BACT|nr:8-amino-7-oxononanoate synthase [Pseudobythopirellula maris]TWT88195.1 8-amino-7-oxononanoate synthase [Pseudobythopirellula maris]
MPPHPSLAWIDDELLRWEEAGLRRRPSIRSAPQGETTVVDGRALVNFGSNDYLGLAGDPRLAEAAARAAAEFGWGAGASALVSGRSAVHAELERRLAQHEGAEAALLFPSGFAANAGTVAALVGRGDAVYSDAKNHASLIDGCRLSSAERFVYPHNDPAALDAMLAQRQRFRRRLIVTDTLFSMDGDLAPLSELAELARRHDAMLLVDEAHATGVWGANGRGVVEHAAASDTAIEETAIVRIGTLSKALGSAGGFVVGSQSLIDWLANRARSYVFSTATPAPVAAAAIAALDIVREEPQRRIDLLRRAARLSRRLRERGWDLGPPKPGPETEIASQVIPIIVGDVDAAMRLSAALREAGFFVPAIRPPTVPEGEAMLRLSLCASHSEESIDRLVEALGSPQLPGA